MKIKLDENLPKRLVEALARFGHDVDTVQMEGLIGARDDHVWQAAMDANRFFITQDLDFSDMRRFAPGTHPGLLLVRLHEPGAIALAEKLTAVFANEPVEKWLGCFVVLTDHKVRVKYP